MLFSYKFSHYAKKMRTTKLFKDKNAVANSVLSQPEGKPYSATSVTKMNNNKQTEYV